MASLTADQRRRAGFSVLLVCTANRCRSPLAEFALVRAARRARLGWSISSAGTSAVPGRPPDQQVVRILTDHGEDLSGWRSRRLDGELVDRSDLILVMSEEHRADLAMLNPAALIRTQLLLGFADQVARLDRSSFSADLGPELVAGARRVSGRPDPEPLDVADPVGRPRRAFLRCARQVEAAAADIVFGRP